MTTISKASGPFAVRFWHWLGFLEHLKACWPPPRCPFGPARRFSAWLGHTSWCPKLLQNRWHDAAHLSRSNNLASPLPGTIAGLSNRASQHQLVHRRCHHHAPALELLGRTDMHFRPEQILF